MGITCFGLRHVVLIKHFIKCCSFVETHNSLRHVFSNKTSSSLRHVLENTIRYGIILLGLTGGPWDTMGPHWESMGGPQGPTRGHVPMGSPWGFVGAHRPRDARDRMESQGGLWRATPWGSHADSMGSDMGAMETHGDRWGPIGPWRRQGSQWGAHARLRITSWKHYCICVCVCLFEHLP